MKNCSVEGCTNKVFGKHFCKFHYPSSIKKKPLAKTRGYIISVGKKQMEMINEAFRDAYNYEKRNEFFKEIWSVRQHFSEVSKTFLGHTANTMFFHHILPKRTYKEAEFDSQNIVLLTPEEHASVELDIYKYDVINQKREFLKKKYNIM